MFNVFCWNVGCNNLWIYQKWYDFLLSILFFFSLAQHLAIYLFISYELYCAHLFLFFSIFLDWQAFIQINPLEEKKVKRSEKPKGR